MLHGNHSLDSTFVGFLVFYFKAQELFPLPRIHKIVQKGREINTNRWHFTDLLSKDDQWLWTIQGNPHLHLSPLNSGCKETAFGISPWEEQLPRFHLLQNTDKLVSASAWISEMYLVSQTTPAYTHYLHRWQFLFTSTVLLLTWRTALVFFMVLKLNNILR